MQLSAGRISYVWRGRLPLSALQASAGTSVCPSCLVAATHATQHPLAFLKPGISSSTAAVPSSSVQHMQLRLNCKLTPAMVQFAFDRVFGATCFGNESTRLLTVPLPGCSCMAQMTEQQVSSLWTMLAGEHRQWQAGHLVRSHHLKSYWCVYYSLRAAPVVAGYKVLQHGAPCLFGCRFSSYLASAMHQSATICVRALCIKDAAAVCVQCQACEHPPPSLLHCQPVASSSIIPCGHCMQGLQPGGMLRPMGQQPAGMMAPGMGQMPGKSTSMSCVIHHVCASCCLGCSLMMQAIYLNTVDCKAVSVCHPCREAYGLQSCACDLSVVGCLLCAIGVLYLRFRVVRMLLSVGPCYVL